MSELHEKTLSDLKGETGESDLFIDIIKEWQIAKIKNCKNTTMELHTENNEDGKLEWIPFGDVCHHGKRCQSCKDKMKDHVITEEMLK